MKKVLMMMAVAMIALAGCKGKQAKQGEEHACDKCMDGRWSIVKVLDVEPSAALKDSVAFVFNKAEGSVQVKAGCNIINVSFQQECEKITFGEGLSTKMACPDMSLEDACLKALPRVTGIKKGMGKAEMTDAQGNVIITLQKSAN